MIIMSFMKTSVKSAGEIIRECREDRDMTQAELAEASGVSVISICCYETGSRRPNLASLVKLSRVFGKPFLGEVVDAISRQ